MNIFISNTAKWNDAMKLTKEKCEWKMTGMYIENALFAWVFPYCVCSSWSLSSSQIVSHLSRLGSITRSRVCEVVSLLQFYGDRFLRVWGSP